MSLLTSMSKLDLMSGIACVVILFIFNRLFTRIKVNGCVSCFVNILCQLFRWRIIRIQIQKRKRNYIRPKNVKKSMMARQLSKKPSKNYVMISSHIQILWNDPKSWVLGSLFDKGFEKIFKNRSSSSLPRRQKWKLHEWFRSLWSY